MKEWSFRILHLVLERLADSPQVSLPEVLANPREILVFPQESLFVLPFVQVLKRIYPEAKVRVLVEEKGATLSGSQEVDEVIGYERRSLSLLSARFRDLRDQLQDYDFDLAFLLSPNPTALQDLLLFFSRAKLRIGHHRPENFPFLNFSVTSGNVFSDELEGSLRLLRALGHRESPGESLEASLVPK